MAPQGGVAATVVFDVITALVMPLIELAPTSSFAVIGDTAAQFFALTSLSVAGGVPLGLLLHYLIGLALGNLFGWAAVRIPAFAQVPSGAGLAWASCTPR